MAYYSSGNGIQRTAPVVFNLIIINVIVFIAQQVFDTRTGFSLSDKLAIHGYQSEFFEPYQLVTNMFAHGGIGHIFFNMFNLYVFGAWLERVWGPKRFLFFYLACGLVAGAVEMLVLKDFLYIDPSTGASEIIPGGAYGASGAIMGLFAAFAYLFPNTPLYMMFIPVPVKAKYVVMVMVALDLFGQFGPYKTGIAHFAHLAGLVTGFIIVIFWRKNRKTFY
ncbi:rhomboid family intramembrane serine protease [Ferruginibacter sp. HRS2-29]|uniref:rhomboid family intramembrane serine protease n=1 Tax=Ferruginibacter sp. HRS2-29 TaxID=2487334 RepID=UPI0020CE8E7C|nr:rhomboid family intramembrane serine protease [Ferruginibacter sp. HRS2-29]MCP9752916.1 rhomboid family intramembrane serine protease [Ferruginibacter sp. HRS2-29]